MKNVRISDFCMKYGVKKRSVDYWTNLGLIHPNVNPRNGYRDYGEIAEEEVKDILLVQVINDGKVTKAEIAKLDDYTKEKWRDAVLSKISDAYSANRDRFDLILNHANERIERS